MGKWPIRHHRCWLTCSIHVSLHERLIEIFSLLHNSKFAVADENVRLHPYLQYPRVHNVRGICMIACRLFEHYLFPLLFFLWLSAVRMRTHPWAKESKIDHTSNWSRCTGTGSSSRADLSHAGKIMHPELTAQHTRL